MRFLRRLLAALGLTPSPGMSLMPATMPDWNQITDHQWRTMSDTQLAGLCGCTPAAASAARTRLGKPPSPAGHGGARPNSGPALKGDDDEMTTAVINLTKGEKREMMAAHKRAGKPWNEWALVELLASSRRK